MTEIDVSAIRDQECCMLSASAFELGQNAGAITWRNCLALSERLPLITDANRDDVRDHFAEYGAWEREEIDAWSDQELGAMVWQEAAADYRHFEDHYGGDLDAYQADCENGQCSGRLYMTETSAYIYLGV